MANRYWVGGTGTWNTTSTTNWSASSGGSSGASVPTASDSVFFDQATTYTVTMTGALLCLDFTVSAGTVTFATGTSPTLAISGSWSIVAATVWSSTGTITFNSTTTGRTLTTNGVTINCSIVFDGVGGAWSLGSALTTGVTRTTTLNNGSITLNGFNLTTGIFSSNNANTRTITLGANNIVLSHTSAGQTVLNMADVTSLTLTGTGGFTADASVTRTYTFGTTSGSTTNAPNLSLTGSGTAVQTVTNGSWWNKLDFGSTAFTATSTTQNIQSLTLSSAGTYTALSVNVVSAGGTLIFNSQSCGSLSIGHTGTTTVGSAGAFNTFTTTLTPTLDCAGFSFYGSGTMTWPATTTVILGTNGTFGTTGQLNVTGQTLAPTTGQTYRSGTFNPTSCTVNLTLGGNLIIGGGVTLISTTFTYGGTSTLTLGTGNFSQSTGSTVTFNKSYSGFAGIYNHSAGTLTIADGVTFDIAAYSSVGSTTARSIVFGTASAGNINLNSTIATSTVLSIGNSTGFSATGPGGFTRDASIAVSINVSQTGASSANAPNLTLTGSGTAVITFSNNSWFNKLDFGTTAFALATTIFNVNSITLSSGGTFTTTTINAIGTGQIITSGQTISTITINHSGTTTLGNAITCSGFNQTAGSINFQSYNLNSTSFNWTTGTYTNMGTITCNNFNVQGAFDFTSGTINASTNVSITAPFSYGGTASLGSPSNFNHNSSTVTFNKSYTTSNSYTLSAGTLTLNSSVTLGVFGSSNSNTRNIEFNTYYITILSLSMATATGFTYTGTGGFTTTAATIRTYVFGTTGGSTTNAPNLSLTGSGTAIQTFTTGSWFKNLSFGTTAFTVPTTALSIVGDLTLSSGGTFTGLTVTMLSTSTITSNGQSLAGLTVNTTGTATLADALTASGALTLTQGTLACSSYAVTSATFASTGSLTRAITGFSTYTITGAGAAAFSNASATGITITGLIISMTAATAKTFAGGGVSYPTLNQGGAGALTISGNNTFADLTATTQPSTITFTASSTQTFNFFTLSGNVSTASIVTINSSTPGTQATLSKASGTINASYLLIQDSNATGGASWNAQNSINAGNNSGWLITGSSGMFLMF